MTSSPLNITVFSHYAPTLIGFRKPLLCELVKAGHRVTAYAPEGDCPGTQEIGITYKPCPFERTGFNPLKDIRLVITYAKILKNNKPDILFIYAIKPNIYGNLAALLVRKKPPRIYSLVPGMGNAFTDTGKSAKKKCIRFIAVVLMRLAFKKTTGVITQNEDDKNELVKYRIVTSNKIHVVNGSGVDTRRYAPLPYPKPTTFLMMSRLLKEKGVLDYLEAARILKQRHPGAKCLLLGGYEPHPFALKEADIQPYIKDGTVEYLGESNDVMPFLSSSSVGVLPSYREGTPNSVLEFMACGRPTIVTDTIGCRETTLNGKTGIVVPVRSPRCLADAMALFCEDDSLIGTMGKAAREYCLQKYDVNKVTKQYMKVMGLI
jgi:glycosyltransferase involved in cell wall biosynthesis